ncbi:MAG: hypothetical protein WD096_11385 [Actinomycetota bacterium]
MNAATARKALVWVLGGTTVGLFLVGEPRAGAAMTVLSLCFGALFVGTWWIRDRPRADAYRAEARRLRLDYAFEDPHDLLSLPHPLLHRVVHMRGLEHVSWGTWNGMSVEVFEYWYTVGSDPGRTDYERFTCVLTPVPATWPDLVIEPERVATLLPQAVGLRDVAFESETFNRAYRVRCADPRFASAFIDARMMAWLLDEATGYGFQIADHRLLAFTERVQPWQTESVLGMTGGFLVQAPRAIASLYPE